MSAHVVGLDGFTRVRIIALGERLMVYFYDGDDCVFTGTGRNAIALGFEDKTQPLCDSVFLSDLLALLRKHEVSTSAAGGTR
jgi:hypothetical protein